LTIDLAAVPDLQNRHHPLVVVYLINDAV